jgi:Fe-S-cluster-containing hydrogenase component 2
MRPVAVVNPDLCDKRPVCPSMRFCPQKAISQKSEGRFFGGGLSIVDQSKCTGCGVCMRYCPRGAISLVSV